MSDIERGARLSGTNPGHPAEDRRAPTPTRRASATGAPTTRPRTAGEQAMRWLPCPLLLILCSALAFAGPEVCAGWKGGDQLFWGGCLSIISCGGVIGSYLLNPELRHHPNPLILWRSVADLMLGACFVAPAFLPAVRALESISEDQKPCRYLSSATQFLFLASELWFFFLSVDLWSTLTNPFTNYARQMRRYHLWTWALAGATFVAMVSLPDSYGMSHSHFCWAREDPSLVGKDGKTRLLSLNKYLWGFFYVWIIGFYAFGMWVLVAAWRRLRRGAQGSFKARSRVIKISIRYLFALTAYWTLALAVNNAAVYEAGIEEEGTSMRPVNEVAAFVYVSYLTASAFSLFYLLALTPLLVPLSLLYLRSTQVRRQGLDRRDGLDADQHGGGVGAAAWRHRRAPAYAHHDPHAPCGRVVGLALGRRLVAAVVRRLGRLRLLLLLFLLLLLLLPLLGDRRQRRGGGGRGGDHRGSGSRC